MLKFLCGSKRRSPVILTSLNHFGQKSSYSSLTDSISSATNNSMKSVNENGAIDELKSTINAASFAIPLHGDQVDIIQTPREFYANINNMVASAQRRIAMSTLYVGVGELEQKLVDNIRKRMNGRPEISVNMHLDGLRGQRKERSNGKSSVSMLKPLAEMGAHISLYHTPELNGWKLKLFPERYNETLGLSHFKAIVVDNDVILTGANLSASYFTDRQDRYVRFRNCPRLADYFCDLIQVVSKLSFSLPNDDSQELLPPADDCPSPVDQPIQFKAFGNSLISKFVLDQSSNNENEHLSDDNEPDTWVYPLIQMKSFGIQQDEQAILNLLDTAIQKLCTRLTISSGYFNLTEELESRLLEYKGPVRILCASERANGFFGAKGAAGYVPDAYSHLLKLFLDQVHKRGLKYQITAWQFDRPSWTFHAKGLWMYPTRESILPALMSIGSPNYGYRSTHRDLEAEVLLVTRNSGLRERMQDELEQLFKFTQGIELQQLEKSGATPAWIPWVIPYIRTHF